MNSIVALCIVSAILSSIACTLIASALAMHTRNTEENAEVITRAAERWQRDNTGRNVQ